MLKSLEKKRQPAGVSETATDAIRCGACGHVREPETSCPDWQCPGCGSAYNKVNAPREELLSQQDLRRLNQEYLVRKKQENSLLRTAYMAEREYPATTGFITGLKILLKSSAFTCAGAAVLPYIKAAGIIIMIASLAYGTWKFLQ